MKTTKLFVLGAFILSMAFVGFAPKRSLAVQTVTGTKVCTVITQSMRIGARGGEVSELQNFLSTLGYSTGGSDGVFGSKTRSAVIAFQSAQHIGTDGSVGPMTRAELLKFNCCQ